MKCCLVPMIFALACDGVAHDDAGNATPTVTMRDSGAVTIAESNAPRWNAGSEWRVSEQPLVDIGGSPSDTSAQFTGITSVHRLPDGNIAVLDVGSYSLRFFDSLGKLVARVGRRGSGPGEFASSYIPRAFNCGRDTLYVPRLGEILVFTMQTGFVRHFRLTPAAGRFPLAQGCSGDRILAWTQTQEPIQRAGNHRMSGAVALFDLAGNAQAVLGTFPMEDQTYGNSRGEGWGYRPTPYGRRLVSAISNSRIVTGIGDAFELEIRDHSGALRRIVRAPGLQKPLLESEVQRYRDFVLPRVGYSKAIDSSLTAAHLPATIPAYAAIHFDMSDNLWVREYDFADAVIFYDRPVRTSGARERAAEPLPQRWHVFEPDGALLGDVLLPPKFEVRQIGPDWILGVWRNDLNVEHVRIYKLIKPQ